MSDEGWKKLNEEIGEAEHAGDKAWLNAVLGWEFAFKRATGKLVNREAYLEAVHESSKRKTTNVKVVESGKTFAVVTCTVEEEDGKKYNNVRLFIRQAKEDEVNNEWVKNEWLLIGWANETIASDEAETG